MISDNQETISRHGGKGRFRHVNMRVGIIECDQSRNEVCANVPTGEASPLRRNQFISSRVEVEQQLQWVLCEYRHLTMNAEPVIIINDALTDEQRSFMSNHMLCPPLHLPNRIGGLLYIAEG